MKSNDDLLFSFDVSVGPETHTRKAEVSEAWWQLAEARQATLEHVREPMKGVLTHFLGEFPRRFGEVQVVIRGNMNHCYNNL